MSQNRRINLLKTLSKADIEQVLDQYGYEQPMFHPLMYGNDKGHVGNVIGGKFSNSEISKIDPSDLKEEWEHLFCQNNFAHKLKSSALNGNLGTDNFRSICWRMFWECLSENKEKWVEEVIEKRKLYDAIRNKYVIDPYEKEQHVDLEKHHPLSQAEDSIWHQYFQDNELRSTIMQDLDRLFPEIDFFQQDCVKSIILHILFCYARENPQVQYKQGMHEILSPIIYVMVLNSLVVKESGDELDEDMKVVMDLKFIEYDAYALFFNIMETIEPWYANLQPHPLQGNQTTAISKKLTRIQCYMLKRYDNTLRQHLEKIEVTPQLYGIRWVRLLFGREFTLNRLLVLWDAIFADGIDLVDYIYLAMLINLRGALIQSDFSECLRYLMKYPANTDTKYILKRAVGLKNHKFTETAKYVPKSEINQAEGIVTNINSSDKSIYFHSLGNGHSTAGHSTADQYNNSMKADGAGTKRSPINIRSNSIASQLSHIKNKVGTTSQMISRLSNPLKNKCPDKQYVDVDINTLIEDHGHLQKQVSELQSQLDKINALSIYCGGKMDLYINLLHQCLMKEEVSDALGIHSFAGLKQVRDILKDGLEHCGTISDHEDDFRDIDEHIADASNNLPVGGITDSDEQTCECGNVETNETIEKTSSDYFITNDIEIKNKISETDGIDYSLNNTVNIIEQENTSQPVEVNNVATAATETIPTSPLCFDTKYFKSSSNVENQEDGTVEDNAKSSDSSSISHLDPLSAFQND